MDRRWSDLADILVHYSTAIQPGERVLIGMHEVETLPLVRAIYEKAVQAGGLVQVLFNSEYLKHSLLRHGNQEQISWLPELETQGLEWANVYFGLRGGHNLYELADIPSEKLALHQHILGNLSSLRWEKTRWCLLRIPDESFAQQSHTDLETITNLFFDACLRDWTAESRAWQRIADHLGQGREIHLLGPGLDLHFSIVGRTWVVGNGRLNMPDGEIFTAPVAESLEGQIAFNLPGVFGGRLIENIHLRWMRGHLESATSSTHQDYLQQITATDPGAGRVGEFGFGVNPAIDRFCNDILLDEKIGGTIHLALGRAYPECRGDNRSAIHWDIVHDMRPGGEVYLDNQLIYKNGHFLY